MLTPKEFESVKRNRESIEGLFLVNTIRTGLTSGKTVIVLDGYPSDGAREFAIQECEKAGWHVLFSYRPKTFVAQEAIAQLTPLTKETPTHAND